MELRNISFNEAEHSYKDEMGNRYISVTQLLSKITPEFNRRFWLMYKALESPNKKMRADVANNKIYIDNIGYDVDILYTKPDVIKKIKAIDSEWEEVKEEACAKGTREHNYLENCINGVSGTGDVKYNDIVIGGKTDYKLKISTLIELEKSTLKETHYFVYNKLKEFISQGFTIFSEKRVYSAKYKIAGTIDVLVFNHQTKEFYILDWKTNKREIKFTSGYFKKTWIGGIKVETTEYIIKDERLHYPVNHLQKCKGIEYSLQLSLYAHLCEEFGLKCKGLLLCHLRDGQTIPYNYPITYYKNEAKQLCEWYSSGEVKPKVKFGIK